MFATKKAYSYFSPLLFCLLLSHMTSYGQRGSFDRSKQLIIGLKGGVNFTQPLVLQEHSVFTGMGISSQKTYRPFIKNMGYGGGIFLMYRITNRLSVTLEGLYYQYRFSYENRYQWADASEGTSYTLEQENFNRLNYFETPLMLRYDVTIRKVTPFVQGGLFSGFMNSAVFQSISRQYSSQLIQSEETQNPLIQTSDRFTKVHFGAIGGAGITFFAGRAMFTLGGNVRYSLLPITGNLNRYNGQSTASTAYLDVADKLNLLNLEIYLSIGLPVSFSEKSQPKFGTNYCSFGR